MKLQTLLLPLLPLSLTTTASASENASTPSPNPPTEPTPIGALWTSTWDTQSLSPYAQHCASTTSHTAKIYKLNQLYPDLATYAPQLKVFYNKQLYAGSWGGIDVHGVGRELLMMEMADVPVKVRDWMKREKEQKHYCVQDDVVFFAPGAVYPILPLWVDDVEEVKEGEGDVCEGVYEGLESYSNEPADGKVIGKLRHSNTGDKEVRFTVEAMVVRAKEGRDEL
ncbi:hypothetical protein DDE82_008955 [Stemphylium lycopersici]|uniref:Uncharacterized protein n=1 Tax=Stemphylium lycopersici TaxID=183478 RepID=A0A364NBP4_STELY|nr:hypothetical protein TW65_97122 [Stemphylium lycopersici]RAQ98744.1 hypothetical protein DDE82_008955 [Stemphylium lycopersici]RAR14650.1 hypothetical protein DDE83_001873 [Stemphylium lycopersici]